MSKSQATIGAVEKRELAKIIDEEFDTIINQMTQEMKFTEGEILEQAEKKFGLKCINKQIKQLQAQISMLEKQKTDLGFNIHGNGFSKTWHNSDNIVDPNTKAGKFYYMKMARNVDIQNLRDQRNSRLKKLWLLDQREDVVKLSNEKVDVKCLPKPKK